MPAHCTETMSTKAIGEGPKASHRAGSDNNNKIPAKIRYMCKTLTSIKDVMTFQNYKKHELIQREKWVKNSNKHNFMIILNCRCLQDYLTSR